MGNKVRIVLVVMLIALLSLYGLIHFNIINLNNNENSDSIKVIEVNPEKKEVIGDRIVLSNALYSKGFEGAEIINQSIDDYQNDRINKTEFIDIVTHQNKRITYYYLVNLKQKVPKELLQTQNEITYNLYMMKEASEEALKYLKDNSNLRLKVTKNIVETIQKNRTSVNEKIGNEIARYLINTDQVVINDQIWEEEYEFIKTIPQIVAFKDLNSAELSTYDYYLKTINENFMLLGWEIQNIYEAKNKFVNEEISHEKLISVIKSSGYVVRNIYNEFEYLEKPDSLSKLTDDTEKTLRLYRDALTEIEKYNMNQDLEHFEKSMIYLEQANEKAARIGEFIYSVRFQYRFD